MKILAVIGSPRKSGNTYRVVERVRKNLEQWEDGIDFEYLFIGEQNIEACKGCFNCFAHGKDKCPIHDDCASIESKMLQADGIILAAPCYAMGVPGIMKDLIDRLAYTLHRPCFFDKVFLAVSTVGGPMGLKQTLGQLAVLSAGGRLAGKLGVSCPPIPMGGLEKKAAKDIRRASSAFYRMLKKQTRKLPGAGDWAYFHAFKTFSTFECYQKVCPADYAYYREKGEYFYPLRGHMMRRLLGKVFQFLMRFSFRLLVKEG